MEGLARDRRTVKDRRQRPTRPFSKYMLSGRRQLIRRQTDRKSHLCVDRYGHRLLIPLLLIVLLSVLDAYLTIFHVEQGAEEVNPLMSFLIDHGYVYFFVGKYMLTAFAVFIFCIYKNHVVIRIGILSALSIYALVFTHHLFWVFLM